MGSLGPEPALISGIAHVNLIVPVGSLSAAHAFYGSTLGLHSIPVPKSMEGKLAWLVALRGSQGHGLPVSFLAR